jgi:hypothetical protein
MGLLSDKAQAAVAGGGAYLNPSKIASGSTVRFCLLSDEPLEFYEGWAENPADGKAKPFRFDFEPGPDDMALAFGDFTRRMNREGTGPEAVKFALALPVYNFDASQVQILQLSQKSLIRELDAVSQMEDYSDILAIDFQLGKTGSGLSTEYKLTPVPRKRGADKAITEAWEESRAAGFDLSRLLSGEDPFKPAK